MRKIKHAHPIIMNPTHTKSVGKFLINYCGMALRESIFSRELCAP